MKSKAKRRYGKDARTRKQVQEDNEYSLRLAIKAKQEENGNYIQVVPDSFIAYSEAPTLKQAALDSKDNPFLWFPEIEHKELHHLFLDICTEYRQRKFPLLLRDGCGQGGVYPAESHWLICEENDSWIRKHLKDVIAISKIIPPSQAICYHTGCLGDIIAAGPVFRALGGVHLKIGNFKEAKWAHRNMEGKPFDSIKPLLEIQPYIKSVSFEHGAEHTYDLENWRVKHQKDWTLTRCQAEFLGLGDVDMSPWIENVKPSEETKGKVVIARSARYQNPHFPWRGIVEHEFHVGKCVFIGLEDEHAEFCNYVGQPIPYRSTRNLLEVAELIAGCALFIGNQSSPCWIAMGLGHRLIQETSPDVQDSMVKRDNAQFPLVGDIKIRPL